MSPTLSRFIAYLIVLLGALPSTTVLGQEKHISEDVKYVIQIEKKLDEYTADQLTTRRFKPADLEPLFRALPPAFSVAVAGHSVAGRPIRRVTWGHGPVEVLLWSQMHGDEPTATAALFDLFNILGGGNDGLDSLRTLLDSTLHLTFLPMLNPDGAQRFERRNALGIDLNRDALHLTSPEARLLKAERDRLDADWGFNLHDQGVYYSAGFPAEKGCVLSILAPAFDWAKTMSPKRTDAAKLIALMDELWQQRVPGQVGRYNDDFEPRAFGDNLQRWGTRTVLIESGGYPGDPEKQEIRKLNVLALVYGLHAIATGAYHDFTLDDYFAIPENESNGMHAVILERARVERGDTTYVLDIGFRVREENLGDAARDYTATGFVSDLGDLSTFGAFARVDLDSMRVKPGRLYPATLSLAEARKLDVAKLHRQGYTAVRLERAVPAGTGPEGLRLLGPRERLREEVAYGASADLLVYDAEDRLVITVINGHLTDLRQ